MHSLHCIDVARTLRQVCVSDVPQPQKSWAPESYKAAATRLTSFNERGLNLADSIDEYAEAWNAFIQHGDEHSLREPVFARTVNDIADANEKIITDIRKDLKTSIKENGSTITRHSGNPGQECRLTCAQVIPESRETRQIREQILGWSMKDYCYHHPLNGLLSKSSLRWTQLEYATSLLKLLLLAQIHAEYVYAGQPLEVKVDRQKQLEAMQNLDTKRQQLRSKEQNEANKSLHYGNPIGVLRVSDFHPLPLSIMVSHWFKPQQASTNTVQLQEGSHAIREAEIQQIIGCRTGISTEETACVLEELNSLKAQHEELMQKTSNLVIRLSGSRISTTSQEGLANRPTHLADTIYNYIFSKTAGTAPGAVNKNTKAPESPAELDGTGKQEISGSCHHHPAEKPTESRDQSRRSSVWGLEDAFTSHQSFDLAELERHQLLSTRSEPYHKYADNDTDDFSNDNYRKRTLLEKI